MEVHEIQEKMQVFEKSIGEAVSKFNKETGTVIQMELTYSVSQQIGGRTTYVPEVRLKATIRS